ncbi:hypothetical protein HYV57_05620 [Candidatus Peregrinibacteria bacterium]|nr:hypothetical protein [Candidatus Peregrinibacteria bacterium]
MLYYNTSEARKQLNDIINRVKYQKVIISIGRRGKAEVLIIPKIDTDESLPISEINTASQSFDFLAEEPEMYSVNDLKKRYV